MGAAPLSSPPRWIAEIWVAADSVGCGPRWCLVPARVRVVAGGNVIADFYHRKHATHLDVAMGSNTRSHGQGVFGPAHVSHIDVALVFSHTVFAHWHIARYDVLNLSANT